jgi:hypothetical protein
MTVAIMEEAEDSVRVRMRVRRGEGTKLTSGWRGIKDALSGC